MAIKVVVNYPTSKEGIEYITKEQSYAIANLLKEALTEAELNTFTKTTG